MTNREAMGTVLDAAELFITLMKEKSMDFKHEELSEAIEVMNEELVMLDKVMAELEEAKAKENEGRS